VRWSSVELLIASLVLRSLLVLLLWTLMSIVTYFSIVVACIGVIGCTTLHWSIVGHSLACCRIASLLRGTLVTILLLVLRALLELVTLRILTMVSLVRWSMTPLLKTLMGIGTWACVASRSLPLKPPLLGFHLFTLIVNHNSAVHQRLKVRVCVGHQLELQAIIKSLEEMALLLLIISYIIWSIM
jgi:hypothetical protein